MDNPSTINEMDFDYLKLLQGRYEAERLPEDFSPERIAPDFAFNVLNALGLLYRPMADEHYLETGGKKPIWPDEKPFAVCLTHDVERVSIYSLQQALRKRLLRLSNTPSVTQKIKHILGFVNNLTRFGSRYGEKDPLHCYERWREVEREIGAHSTFFFWPGLSSVTKRHHTDCNYELYDRVVFDGQKCTVAEMIQDIGQRGWEIGLHPSWYSFDDVDELKRQKEALENALGHDVLSVRQHYLHYDIRITPRVHAEAGFKYDSTLGFSDNIGFRFGTCYPLHLYDLHAENELPILEIPLIVQDGAMLTPIKGLGLDEDTAFQYVVLITEAVEKVGGVLTILWHPHMINNMVWWNLYLRTIEYFQQKSPWFASVREVGGWWEKQLNTGSSCRR